MNSIITGGSFRRRGGVNQVPEYLYQVPEYVYQVPEYMYQVPEYMYQLPEYLYQVPEYFYQVPECKYQVQDLPISMGIKRRILNRTIFYIVPEYYLCNISESKPSYVPCNMKHCTRTLRVIFTRE